MWRGLQFICFSKRGSPKPKRKREKRAILFFHTLLEKKQRDRLRRFHQGPRIQRGMHVDAAILASERCYPSVVSVCHAVALVALDRGS